MSELNLCDHQILLTFFSYLNTFKKIMQLKCQKGGTPCIKDSLRDSIFNFLSGALKATSTLFFSFTKVWRSFFSPYSKNTIDE